MGVCVVCVCACLCLFVCNGKVCARVCRVCVLVPAGVCALGRCVRRVWLVCGWCVVGVWLVCGWCVWLVCGWCVVGVWLLLCRVCVCVRLEGCVCRYLHGCLAVSRRCSFIMWSPVHSMCGFASGHGRCLHFCFECPTSDVSICVLGVCVRYAAP